MYKIFETFVGAGGSHIGFKNQGFVSIYVNDNVQECIDTLLFNNPELEETAFIDNRSILDVDKDTILNKTKLKKGELDVMFGGIVCKGFSLAGERSPNDERNYFFYKQIELVSELKPKISIIENVKGILNAKVLSKKTPKEIKNRVDEIWQELENYKGKKADLRKKNKITKEFENQGLKLREDKDKILDELSKKGYLVNVLDEIKNLYEEIGYNTSYRVLNSSWYGSATARDRVIIVATRKGLKGEFNFPKPTHFDKNQKNKALEWGLDLEKVKPLVTVGDALKKINYSKNDIDNIPMSHSEKTVTRFKFIPEGDSIANHIDKLPKHLKISKFYSRGNTMRLSRKKPSPTLVPGHSNFPVHPVEDRSITVREAATITGFPLDYKFIGSHTKRCEHVGNAVPPPLAEAIAKSCAEFLEKN